MQTHTKYYLEHTYIRHLHRTRQTIALTTTHHTVFYGHNTALTGVSLPFTRYKITHYIGSSGSGLSLYLRSLNHLLDNITSARVTGKILYRLITLNRHAVHV